jgi:hypothetical protein
MRDAGSMDGPMSGADTPLSDGGVPGRFWMLETRAASLSIQHEPGCTQFEGGRIAVSVAVPLATTCEHSGPVSIREADGVTYVRAHVWVERRADTSGCRPSSSTARQTLLLPAREGRFTAVDELGLGRVEYRVSSVDDLPCTNDRGRNAPCLMDCECADDLLCIPQLGDGAVCSGGYCGDPCNVVSGEASPVMDEYLECEAGHACRPHVAAGSFACQPIERERCLSDPCALGRACVIGGCSWTLELRPEDRHVCDTDDDCEPGLLCVAHSDGLRCEVPCFTNETVCPDMHACSLGTWVCEWTGD